MGTQAHLHEIADAVIEGIEAAYDDYSNWVDKPLGSAPEYLMTIRIAERIYEIEKDFCVELEKNMEQLLYDAGIRGAGKLPSDIRGNGRADILVTKANKSPRGIIEAKVRKEFSEYRKDIKRISWLLKKAKQGKKNQQMFGILACYLFANGGAFKDRDKKKESAGSKIMEYTNELKRMANKANKELKARIYYPVNQQEHITYLDDDLDNDVYAIAWSPCCLIIT